MLSQIENQMTVKQYLAAERVSEIKHEFFDGAIFAVAGASKTHNRISANLVRVIGNELLAVSLHNLIRMCGRQYVTTKQDWL